MFSIYLIILLAVLAAWKKTRRFAFYFLPWFLFGIIYDSMRLYPNYMVNDIDVANLYHAEKSLFGIAASSSAELQAVADHSQLMIPGEYFKVHHCGFADFWFESHSVITGVDSLGIPQWEDRPYVFISEPQIWYNVGQHFGVPNLNVGGEVELSFDFGTSPGFKARPCAGIKWVF